MLKFLILSVLGCLCAFSQEKKKSYMNMDGVAFIPIVILVDVGLPDENGDLKFNIKHNHT
ncbi:MAG: hypothetical protein ACI9E1_000537, partial [Cryomorphaceae bacterium]